MKKTIIFLVVFCLSGKASAFELDRIQVHGFVSQGYLHSNQYDYLLVNTHNGTFELNEFGLNFSTRPLDNLRVGLQLLSRDFGEVGNNTIILDWAVGDYRYRNWLGVRVGKLKRPMGLYGASRDIDAARTGVLLPTTFYSELFRDLEAATIGAGLYGTLPGGLEYQVQYGKVEASTDTGIVKVLDQSLGIQTLNVEVTENAPMFQLLWNTPLQGLRLAGTYSSGFAWKQETPLGVFEYDVTSFFLSAEYSYDRVTAAVEYKQSETRTHVGPQHTTNTLENYYGLLSYRVTDWWEVGASYAIGYRNKDDKEGRSLAQRGQPAASGWSKDLALASRFDLNESLIVKLEGHWLNGLYGVTGGLDDDPDEDWYMVAAKVTYSF